MNDINYSLMFVTDDSITNDSLFFEILESALKGGATIIQLREKKENTRAFFQRALRSKKLCQSYNTPLIINDRLDIALAIDADGVHIGQKDLPYLVVRRLLGNDKIIGLSVSNERQASEAQDLNVDYIGLSPIFSTATKTTDIAPPLGIEGLIKIRQTFSKPIICIGGIKRNHVTDIIRNGADGIAVITAISKAENPEKETRQLNHTICQAGLIK